MSSEADHRRLRGLGGLGCRGLLPHSGPAGLYPSPPSLGASARGQIAGHTPRALRWVITPHHVPGGGGPALAAAAPGRQHAPPHALPLQGPMQSTLWQLTAMAPPQHGLGWPLEHAAMAPLPRRPPSRIACEGCYAPHAHCALQPKQQEQEEMAGQGSCATLLFRAAVEADGTSLVGFWYNGTSRGGAQGRKAGCWQETLEACPLQICGGVRAAMAACSPPRAHVRKAVRSKRALAGGAAAARHCWHPACPPPKAPLRGRGARVGMQGPQGREGTRARRRHRRRPQRARRPPGMPCPNGSPAAPPAKSASAHVVAQPGAPECSNQLVPARSQPLTCDAATLGAPAKVPPAPRPLQ